MQVNFYATFRVRAGVKSITLELPDGATMRQAVDAVIARIPALKHDWLRGDGDLHAHVHGFVNGKDVSTLPQGWNTPLVACDTLDFLPPVAGGRDRYRDGSYLAENPTWHVEDSAWKARQIVKMLSKHPLAPLRRVAEVGCGAGEVLVLLQQELPDGVDLSGYEISPQGFALCQPKANQCLHYFNQDLLKSSAPKADLLLAMDVIEHIPDIEGFLCALRGRAAHHIFHVPLELTVQTVWREKPLLRSREKNGHLHFFTRQMALQLLTDCGYEVVDWFYTPAGVDQGKSSKAKLVKLPRRLLFAINQHFAVRLLGGYSLLVLTK